MDGDDVSLGEQSPPPAELSNSARRRAHTRRQWHSRDRITVSVIVAASAIVAMFASSAPTGHDAIDLVERAIFAGGFAFVTTQARRWTWVLSGVVAAACCRVPEAYFGFGSLVVGVVGASRRRREPWMGATAGALAAQGLLRTEWPGTFGLTAAIGAVASVIVAVSAYRTARTAQKRRIRRSVLAASGLLVLIGAIGLGAVLSVRNGLEDGVSHAARGIDLAAGPTPAAGRTLLAQARDDFDTASGRMGGPWMLPSKLIPVLSQHITAVTTLADDGRDLAASAEGVAAAVDIDRLRRNDGSLDLELIGRFRRPLELSSDAVANALDDLEAVRNGWLIEPLVDRMDDFEQRIGRSERSVRLTAEAARFLPALLGGSGDRRYFVMLVTPSETRDLGGHMGNWAEVSLIDGRFDVARSGRTELLGPQAVEGRTLTDPDSYPTSYQSARPALFPQNWGASPDLRTVGRAVFDLYPQSGGGPIDGVAVIDPYGFAALLQLTGPVTEAGGPTLDADNAAEFLLRGQYTAFADGTARGDYLTRLVETTIGRLRTGGTTSPREVVSALAPAVRAHQLQFVSNLEDETGFLADAGLVPAVRRPDSGDQLLVLSTNLGPNKLDAYVTRAVDVSVRIDDDGNVEERVAVTLTSRAPTTGPVEVVGNQQGLPDGTVIDRLSLLTPLAFQDLRIDGAPGSAAPEAEFGLNRYGVPVAVASGESVTVEYVLAGRIPRGSAYRLTMLRQPLASTDRVDVLVTSKGGDPWSLKAASRSVRRRGGRVNFELDSDTRLTFERP